MRVVSDYVDAPARRDFEGMAALRTADGEEEPRAGRRRRRRRRARALHRVTRFGAGPRSMTHALAPAAARLGGIDRSVPGHAHADPVVGDVHGRLERAAAA